MFNKKFCATRIIIENTFSLVKCRFGQLLQVDMDKVSKITRFIVTCCVIHNICIENNDDLKVTEEETVKIVLEENKVSSEDSDVNLKRKGEFKRLEIKNVLCA